MSESWRIEVLKGVRAVSPNGQVVDTFRTTNTAALVAILAQQPGTFRSRDVLSEMLWPGEQSDKQRSRLRYELSNVRKALGPGAIEADGNRAVRLSSRYQSDVASFDVAVRSVTFASSSGERLANLRRAATFIFEEEPLSQFFDSWALEERRRLNDAAFDTLLRLCLELRAAGHEMEARHCSRLARSRFPDRQDEFASETTRGLQHRTSSTGHPTPTSTPDTLARLRSGIPTDTFHGRADEFDAIHKWLAQSVHDRQQLLTVTGIGGMGKTRLATEAFADQDRATAWSIPLEAVSSVSQFWTALRHGLPLPRQNAPVSSTEAAVIQWLQEQKFPFLLLDNFEQLVDVAGAQIARLLTAVPELRCLITSRRRLEIGGEQELRLSGLPLTDAVRLFLTRSQAARGLTKPPLRDVATIEAICALLDGIPLAIELAAARSRILSPIQILKQLDNRFAFLVGRRRDVSTRHLTLRSTLDWSTDMLGDEVRSFLARLTVFRGGFTLEAAEAVCGNAEGRPAFDCLEELSTHSLLEVRFTEQPGTDAGATPRYHLLETVRQYAELLLVDDNRLNAERIHRSFFTNMASNARLGLSASSLSAFHVRFETEHANFVAALTTSERASSSEPVALPRLISALRWIWDLRGNQLELRVWLNRAALPILSQLEDASLKQMSGADIAICAGVLKWLASSLVDVAEADPDRARDIFLKSAALYRHGQYHAEELQTLNYLGSMEIKFGNYLTAHSLLLDNVRRLPEGIGNIPSAEAHHYLGVIYRDWGLYDEASRLFDSAVRMNCGDHQKALVLNQGLLAWSQGSIDVAGRLVYEVLDNRRRWKYRAGQALCLSILGRIATLRDELAEAFRHHDEAITLATQCESPGAIAMARGSWGISLLKSGHYHSAATELESALQLYQTIGNRLGAANVTEYQADLLCLMHSDYSAAVRLWARISLARAEMGTPIPPVDRPWREQRYAEAILALGIDQFDAIWFETIAAPAP